MCGQYAVCASVCVRAFLRGCVVCFRQSLVKMASRDFRGGRDAIDKQIRVFARYIVT